MITSATWGRRPLFSREPWARLLIDTLYHYRGTAYLLHEFVIMPDHIHVLLTPKTSLEKAAQFIKGGFSHRAKKELGSNTEVWQKGFSDHRIRDAGDYLQHVSYIRENPVRKYLCARAEEFSYSSAYPGFVLDTVPQGLKPAISVELDTARLEGVPFQNGESSAPAEGAHLPDRASTALAAGVPFHGRVSIAPADDVPFQRRVSPATDKTATFAKTSNKIA